MRAAQFQRHFSACLSLTINTSTSNSLSAILGTLTGDCAHETNKSGMGWFSSIEPEPLNYRSTAFVSTNHAFFASVFILLFMHKLVSTHHTASWLSSRDPSSSPLVIPHSLSLVLVSYLSLSPVFGRHQDDDHPRCSVLVFSWSSLSSRAVHGSPCSTLSALLGLVTADLGHLIITSTELVFKPN